MSKVGKESIVVIKGGRYRYTYDADSQRMKYLGPVGDSSMLSEDEFMREMSVLTKAQQRDVDFYNAVAAEINGLMTEYSVERINTMNHHPYERDDRIIKEKEITKTIVVDFSYESKSLPLDTKESPFASRTYLYEVKFFDQDNRIGTAVAKIYDQDLGEFTVDFGFKKLPREQHDQFAHRFIFELSDQIREKYPERFKWMSVAQ